MTMRPSSWRVGAALLLASLLAGLLVMLLLRREAGLQPLRGVAPLDMDEEPAPRAVDSGAPAT